MNEATPTGWLYKAKPGIIARFQLQTNRSENYYLLAIAAVMITLATALGWDIKTT